MFAVDWRSSHDHGRLSIVVAITLRVETLPALDGPHSLGGPLELIFRSLRLHFPQLLMRVMTFALLIFAQRL